MSLREFPPTQKKSTLPAGKRNICDVSKSFAALIYPASDDVSDLIRTAGIQRVSVCPEVKPDEYRLQSGLSQEKSIRHELLRIRHQCDWFTRESS